MPPERRDHSHGHRPGPAVAAHNQRHNRLRVPGRAGACSARGPRPCRSPCRRARRHRHRSACRRCGCRDRQCGCRRGHRPQPRRPRRPGRCRGGMPPETRGHPSGYKRAAAAAACPDRNPRPEPGPDRPPSACPRRHRHCPATGCRHNYRDRNRANRSAAPRWSCPPGPPASSRPGRCHTPGHCGRSARHRHNSATSRSPGPGAAGHSPASWRYSSSARSRRAGGRSRGTGGHRPGPLPGNARRSPGAPPSRR